MSDRLAIREAIVVEGRYDRNTLAQAVDAPILETSGFGIFRDEERLALLRRIAATRGLIILTDSDGAGFVIRNFLKGAIPPDQVRHAYIPDVAGKERRKRTPGREGKLGVEGMTPQVLRQALLRAGATPVSAEPGTTDPATAPEPTASSAQAAPLTAADLYRLGLSGTADASSRRRMLLQKLELPEHMSTKALLCALNALYTPEEAESAILSALEQT